MPPNTKFVQLENDLYDLKSAFNSPKVYLSNYFDELRNMIDIDCSLTMTFRSHEKKLSESDVKIMAEEQEELVKAIRVFETECITNWQTDSFADFFRNKIIDAVNEIEDRMRELKTTDVFSMNELGGLLESKKLKGSTKSLRANGDSELKLYEVTQLIEKTMGQVQRVIFRDKAVVYLQKKRLLETIRREDPDIDPKKLLEVSNSHSVGILVFVGDTFIDKKRFDLEKK